MTERDIQKLIKSSHSFGRAFIPNIFWNGQWEADLIEVTHTYNIIEYEIKRTKADFKADFNKKEKHNLFTTLYDISILPNYFNYVCEEGIINEKDIPEYAGLFYIVRSKFNSTQKRLKKIKGAPILHSEKVNYNKWRELAMRLAQKVS
jgi:hypothetical protein